MPVVNGSLCKKNSPGKRSGRCTADRLIQPGVFCPTTDRRPALSRLRLNIGHSFAGIRAGFGFFGLESFRLTPVQIPIFHFLIFILYLLTLSVSANILTAPALGSSTKMCPKELTAKSRPTVPSAKCSAPATTAVKSPTGL